MKNKYEFPKLRAEFTRVALTQLHSYHRDTTKVELYLPKMMPTGWTSHKTQKMFTKVTQKKRNPYEQLMYPQKKTLIYRINSNLLF